MRPTENPATSEQIRKIHDMLRGEAEPLRQFGVQVVDVPWWRRRIQKHLMPGRYRLFVQRRILEQLEQDT